jgi:hypothetical protein
MIKMKENNIISKTVKVDATKRQIVSALKNLDWTLEYGKKYYFTYETKYDDAGYYMGDVMIAIYPANKSFKIEINKDEYPIGDLFEAKNDLERYAEDLKREIERK